MNEPVRRFVSYEHAGEIFVGVYEDHKLFSLSYADMRECIESGMQLRGKTRVEKDVRLLAPLRPGKIVGLGWNYKKHKEELCSPKAAPVIFLKPASAVIGPGEEVVIPPQSRQVEHEVELAVVMGQKAKNVSCSEALDYVAGYTIIIDVTARDLQNEARKKGEPWDVCKGMDTFAPMGPCIVPKEYVPNPNCLDISLAVNGAVRQKSNTRYMINYVEDIVSYVSSHMSLEPGDVIATGTPEGIGKLESGDGIEAEIEKIGVLKNKVR